MPWRGLREADAAAPLPMRGLWDPGKLLSKSKPPGHRTCWNLEPLSVADQHSSLLFAVV